MEQSHILLVHHRRIGAWLPPGGHIEQFELPHETAIRETKEETGVQIVPLSPNFPIPNTGNEDAFFLPAPLCIHAVKAREKDCDYYHVDLAYLCLPVIDPADISLPKTILSEEVHEARWVSLDTLSQLPLASNVVEIVALAKSRLNLT